jgi:probable F420-dependent oxidoreductase
MLVDANIGGSADITGGGGITGVLDEIASAERIGYDGVWAPEIQHNPFPPLFLAADRSPRLHVGTGIAVAFSRNPMTMATAANDLQAFSGGRFTLGIGSQIRPHIERRYGMPWSAPAARMREYVLAMRAIWACWNDGVPLDFRGDFYQHTLMSSMFDPGPNPHGAPPVMVAAVGPKMLDTAAEVADGLLVHALTSERYLREAVLPRLEAVLRRRGLGRERFTLSFPGMIATGSTEEELAKAVEAVRRRIAFYGVTPAYRPVLELHGWGELQTELHRLSRQGDLDAMAGLVDDGVLNAFAVVGEPDEVAKEVLRRFGGLVDRFTPYTPYALADEPKQAVVAGIQQG